jgi:hypothetical protein
MMPTVAEGLFVHIAPLWRNMVTLWRYVCHLSQAVSRGGGREVATEDSKGFCPFFRHLGRGLFTGNERVMGFEFGSCNTFAFAGSAWRGQVGCRYGETDKKVAGGLGFGHMIKQHTG